jgi:hypothetical protein
MAFVVRRGSRRWCGVALSGRFVALGLAVTVTGGCTDAARPGNHAPVVTQQQAITDEDVPVEIRVLEDARDGDGDELSVVDARAEGHGVDILSGGVLKVTPRRDFTGMFIVRYRVTDGVSSTSGLATVMVRPVNDPPTVNGRTQRAHGPVQVVLEASDVEGEALTYEVISGPAHGTLTGTAPDLVYEAMPRSRSASGR